MYPRVRVIIETSQNGICFRKRKGIDIMKKRILSIALCLIILCSLLPISAMAAETYKIWVGGVQITSDNAENVTVPFSDYLKNVASSEIYPTWPEEAIKANILAQSSVALNRIYTEFYRSRG